MACGTAASELARLRNRSCVCEPRRQIWISSLRQKLFPRTGAVARFACLAAGHRNCRVGKVVAVGVALLIHGSQESMRLDQIGWGIGIVAGVCLLGVLVISVLSFRDLSDVARIIEECCPKLSQRLITAVDQRPVRDQRYGYLQDRVIDEAIRHSQLYSWQQEVVPRSRLVMAQISGCLGIVLLAILNAATDIHAGAPCGIRSAESDPIDGSRDRGLTREYRN